MTNELSPLLAIGYISRAHGTRGEIVVRTFDPMSSVLDEVDRVWVKTKTGEERELAIEEVRLSSEDVLVVFEGVRGRPAAQALIGSSVSVFREDLEPPEDGEFFQGDLVGLVVSTPDGVRLGVIEDVWSTGPVPNLVIREGDRELLVPFAEEFVKQVDVPGKTMIIVPPEYD